MPKVAKNKRNKVEHLGLPLFKAMNTPRLSKDLNFQLTSTQTKALFSILVPIKDKSLFVTQFDCAVSQTVGPGPHSNPVVPSTKMLLPHLAAAWGMRDFEKVNPMLMVNQPGTYFFSAILDRCHGNGRRPQNRHLWEATPHPYRCLKKTEIQSSFDRKYETLIIYSSITQTFVCQGCPRTCPSSLASSIPLPAAWFRLQGNEACDGVLIGKGSFIRAITSPIFLLPPFNHTSPARVQSFCCVQVNDFAPEAPLLPPDVGVPTPGTYKDKLMEGNRSNRFACRKYVKGAFHSNIEKAFKTDPDIDEDIGVELLDEQGMTSGLFTWIQLRSVLDPNFLENCVKFGKHMGASNCRQNTADMGKMVAAGFLPHLPQVTRNIRTSQKLQRAASQVNLLASHALGAIFPEATRLIEHLEHCYGEPTPEVGGSSAFVQRLIGTTDFACASHYDPADASTSMVCWVETKPGSSSNWYLLFPNILVEKDGVQYKGLAITLKHGLAAVFDGRLLRHCSTITEREEKQHVYGIFFGSPQRDLVTKKEVLESLDSVAIA